MESLVGMLERDGRDVARRFVIGRALGEDVNQIRGEMAGLATAVSYVTGQGLSEVENGWVEEIEPDARRVVAARFG